MRITLGESIRVVLCRGVLFRRGGVGVVHGSTLLKKERERSIDMATLLIERTTEACLMFRR